MAVDVLDESRDAAASGMPARRMTHAAASLKHEWRLPVAHGATGARRATRGSAHGNR